MTLNVTDEEFHTILAALRARQAPYTEAELDDIASNGGEVEPLSHEEIGALCERLNLGEPDGYRETCPRCLNAVEGELIDVGLCSTPMCAACAAPYVA